MKLSLSFLTHFRFHSVGSSFFQKNGNKKTKTKNSLHNGDTLAIINHIRAKKFLHFQKKICVFFFSLFLNFVNEINKKKQFFIEEVFFFFHKAQMICAFCDNKSPKTRTRVCPPKKITVFSIYVHRLSSHIGKKYSVKTYPLFFSSLFFFVLFCCILRILRFFLNFIIFFISQELFTFLFFS